MKETARRKCYSTQLNERCDFMQQMQSTFRFPIDICDAVIESISVLFEFNGTCHHFLSLLIASKTFFIEAEYQNSITRGIVKQGALLFTFTFAFSFQPSAPWTWLHWSVRANIIVFLCKVRHLYLRLCIIVNECISLSFCVRFINLLRFINSLIHIDCMSEYVSISLDSNLLH